MQNLNATLKVNQYIGGPSYKHLLDPQSKKIKYYWNPEKSGKDFLGSGQYGTVFKAYKMKGDNLMNRKGDVFGLKHIDIRFLKKDKTKLKGNYKIIQNEMNYFQKSNKKFSSHPNLITIYDIFQTANSIYIIMEICEKECTLLDYFSQMRKSNTQISENEIINIIDDILRGLLQLNKAKIMHRDIKLDNIIKLTKASTVWKLCDYGFSRCFENLNVNDKGKFTLSGAPYFQSPQILDNKEYGFKCDIYSIGIVLYNLLFFKCPYPTNSISELREMSLKGLPTPLGENREISKHMETLLRKLLAVEEDNRSRLICESVKDVRIFDQPEYVALKKKSDQEKMKVKAQGLFIQIQKCINTFYTARELFLKFKFIKIDYWIKYILLYSLTKVCSKRFLYLNRMYEQNENIFKDDEILWQNLLQSQEFQAQRTIMKKLQVDINNLEVEVKNIHRTKMESLQNKFDDPSQSILNFLENSKMNLLKLTQAYNVICIHFLRTILLHFDKFPKKITNLLELMLLSTLCHTQFCREIIQENTDSLGDYKFFEKFYRKLANKTFEENLEMFKESRKIFLAIPDKFNLLIQFVKGQKQTG